MFLHAGMIPPLHGSLSYFKSLSLPNRLLCFTYYLSLSTAIQAPRSGFLSLFVHCFIFGLVPTGWTLNKICRMNLQANIFLNLSHVLIFLTSSPMQNLFLFFKGSTFIPSRTVLFFFFLKDSSFDLISDFIKLFVVENFKHISRLIYLISCF